MSDINDADNISYRSVIDSYSTKVKIVEYKSTDGPHAWVYVKGGLSHNSHGHFRLNLEQAKAVRDGLAKWVNDRDYNEPV